jgi:hypothetical protein
MTWTPIPSHNHDEACPHLDTTQGCYWCCQACNQGEHRCQSCNTPVTHRGADKGYKHVSGCAA